MISIRSDGSAHAHLQLNTDISMDSSLDNGFVPKGHYLSQCRARSISPSGVGRPKRVKAEEN